MKKEVSWCLQDSSSAECMKKNRTDFQPSFTKQNWKKQIIASICVVLGIFGVYVHVFQYTQKLTEETTEEETIFN